MAASAVAHRPDALDIPSWEGSEHLRRAMVVWAYIFKSVRRQYKQRVLHRVLLALVRQCKSSRAIASDRMALLSFITSQGLSSIAETCSTFKSV